jgi:D-cysteine desulfhydrase
MNLAKFPRRNYIINETPLTYLPKFSKALGGPSIYIKRDDLAGIEVLSNGGNKIRKLEFLVADALVQGADTLITCGAVQSNHCLLTLAASVREGLKCRLVLEERVPDSYDPNASGNNFLYRLFGAEKITVIEEGQTVLEGMKTAAEQVISEGGKPYIIPGGGSNAIGATGYVSCAQEIMQQSYSQEVNFDYIVCASGSGGTHSGILAGVHGCDMNIPVIGISVRRDKDFQEAHILKLAKETAEFVGVNTEIPSESVTVFDEYVGDGYSIPTKEMSDAVKLLAKTEGILLDPVYTGKAMSGLIGLVKKGYFKKEDKILFVHTGGLASIFHYTNQILEQI